MKRWWLVLALLLSLGVNVGILATLAVARLRPAEVQKAPQGPPEKRLARLADRLGLAGGERERFLTLQRQFFADTGHDRKRLQQIYRQVRRELISARPDPDHLEKLLTESSQVYLAVERAVTANVLATRKIKMVIVTRAEIEQLKSGEELAQLIIEKVTQLHATGGKCY